MNNSSTCGGVPSVSFNTHSDSVPSYTSCYGGRHAVQALIPKYTGFISGSLGVHCDLMDRADLPIDCNSCNVTKLTRVKLDPIECGSLSVNISEHTTKFGLLSEIPHLQRLDIDKLRLTYYEVIGQNMLRRGYHVAFSQLFNLHEFQMAERRNAGPQSTLWYVPPISEQPEKLEKISYHLCTAEEASRRSDSHTVFSSFLLLGLYFRDCPDDLWLAEHFFSLALKVAELIKDDEGLKMAIAYQHYGSILQARDHIKEASTNLKEFHKRTKNKPWKDENGKLLHTTSLSALVDNYLRRIDELPECYHSDRIKLCRKACGVVAEAGMWQVEAPVFLRLGQIYEAAGRIHDSIDTFNIYFEKAVAREDYKHLGNACEALGKLFKIKHEVDRSIPYLLKFASICERHGQWAQLGRACHMLGKAYDSIGNYHVALKWMKKAYNLPNIIQELKLDAGRETTEAARIMIGISRAHSINPSYIQNMLSEPVAAVMRTIRWKNSPDENEVGVFKKDIPIPIRTIRNQDINRDIEHYARDPVTGFQLV